MRIAITGHRPDKLGDDYDLKSPLVQSIQASLEKIIEEHKPTVMISGMALGIDTLWAILAIRHEIPLIAAVPLKGQEKIWPLKSQQLYHTMLKQASKIINVASNKELTYDEYLKEPSDTYTRGMMNNRNKWMVDNCDLLTGVWNGSSGGTSDCINYAISVKRTLVIIKLKP